MKLLSLVAAATALATSVIAQTPPNYTWAQSNQTLYLKFTGFPIFKGGAVLPYAGKPWAKAQKIKSQTNTNGQHQSLRTSRLYTHRHRLSANT